MKHKVTVGTFRIRLGRLAALALTVGALAGCAAMTPSATPAKSTMSSQAPLPELPVIHGSDDGGWGESSG